METKRTMSKLWKIVLYRRFLFCIRFGGFIANHSTVYISFLKKFPSTFHRKSLFSKTTFVLLATDVIKIKKKLTN